MLGASILATGSFLFRPGWEKADCMNLYLLVIILNLESEENGCIYVPLLVPKSYTYYLHLIRKSPALNCGLKIFCGLLNRTSEAKKKKAKDFKSQTWRIILSGFKHLFEPPPPAFFLNLPFGSLAYFLQGKMHGECITHLRYKLNIKKDA